MSMTTEDRVLGVAVLILAAAVVVTVLAVVSTCSAVERAIPSEPR